MPVKTAFSAMLVAARKFIGVQSSGQRFGLETQSGMIFSAIFLAAVAIWMNWVSRSLIYASLGLAVLVVIVLFFSFSNKLTVPQANLLSLLGFLVATFSFYFAYTRLVNVTYVTDSIAGTYMGVQKVLELQNPYLFSIKPVLDQFGLPPSLYTPRVDGSFEFHLNYPAMNFLALVPSYLAGLHDIRDGVFLFHIATALIIFGVVPPRLKPLSLAPFALGFPFVIGYSWTDSVWAFFVLLTAVLWNRDRRLSLMSLGLAVATKQIALVAAPFLLIRLWKEAREPRVQAVVKAIPLGLAGFLTPNLPFVIASPSSWWTAIVVPYLPGKTGLVPGGVGLSEVLPDFGLAISPVVYTALTGLASIVCIGIFFARYNKLSRFLWAMPVVVLFFYPRSLPNYLVFWAFPYLFEWFRYGDPSLGLFRIRNLHLSVPKVTGQKVTGLLRRRVGPFAILSIVLAAAIVGVSGAYASQVSRPRVDITVDGIADPDSLGLATALTVIIVNNGPEPVSPRFFVKWFFLWDYWNPNSTDTMAPASTLGYTLTATDALGAVPGGSSFRVAAYDSVSGELLGLSRLYVSNVSRPKVANPSFMWWTIDLGSGRQAPFAWKPVFAHFPQGLRGISVLDASKGGGAELSMSSTGQQSTAEIGLSQRILFNETDLTAFIHVSASASSPGNAIFGLKAADHFHSLFYVLSSTASARSVSQYESNTTITLPVQDSVWQIVLFDIRGSWENQGWILPSSIEVSFFLRSSQPGQFLFDIQQVTS